MDDLVVIITEFGFAISLAVGMGYFIYYVWKFIINNIQPKLDEMHLALIKCIDANRMLDNDMIRLQQKVDVVLKYEQIHNNEYSTASIDSDPDPVGHTNFQVQESKFQRIESIQPLPDDRESGDKSQEGDPREARSGA